MGKVTPITSAKSKRIVSVDASGGIEAAIPRDQWDRPLIIQLDGSKPVAYRRASTVAEVLEDHFGLETWKRRLAAEGLAQRSDLVDAIRVAKFPKEVGAIVEEAIEQAGGGVAARNGSTMHSLTEMLDNDGDIPLGLPLNIVAMLEKYEEVMKRYETLDTERFVVCDRIKVAGTYDRRLRDRKTGKSYIGDLKTGQNLKYHTLKTPAQVAVYAAGDWYDLDGERTPHKADRDRGVLIHLPWVEKPEDAECDLRWLNLRHGRRAILKAFSVEEFRKAKVNDVLPRIKD